MSNNLFTSPLSWRLPRKPGSSSRARAEVGTQGDTYDEAMTNEREAIEFVIEDRLARGEVIPEDVRPQRERITIAA